MSRFRPLVAVFVAAIAVFALPALMPLLHLGSPDSVPSLTSEDVTALTMAVLIATVPFKVKGQIVKTGDPVTGLTQAELAGVKDYLVQPLNFQATEAFDPESDPAFDLADTLQKLMGEGHDVAEMNMKQIIAMLGDNGKGVKRADVDAALETIKVDVPEDVASVVTVIDTLGSDALGDDTGEVSAAKVAASYAEDEKPSEETIAAAIKVYQSAKA